MHERDRHREYGKLTAKGTYTGSPPPLRFTSNQIMADFLKNPFLVLAVSSDASIIDIKKVADRTLMEMRLHGDEDSPQARAIERAMEELRDPLKRFKWGLFWPELSPREVEPFRSNPILSQLSEDPKQPAAEAYNKICSTDSRVVKSHNFGSLKLIEAVAKTREAQLGTPDDISDDLACAKLWEEAFAHLTIVTESDEFWMRQKMRAKSIDDPRLDDKYVKECRQNYLSEVLEPVGEVIQTALLDGHAKVASTYVDTLWKTDFDDKFIDSTLSSVYKPLADRVERNIKLLQERLEDLDEDTCDVSDFKKLLRDFQVEAHRDLSVMLEVGDLPGYAEEHARDTAAEFLRKLAIRSWNYTGEESVSNEALKFAIKFADASTLKKKFHQDLKDIREIASSNKAMKEVEHLIAQMERFYKQENYDGALLIIDEIIEAVPADQKAEFRQLKLTTRGNAAASLANKGIDHANAGRTNQALKCLKQALKYEHRPDQISLIKQAIRNIGIPGTGFSTGDRQVDGCLTEIGLRILIFGGIILLIAICSGVLGG